MWKIRSISQRTYPKRNECFMMDYTLLISREESRWVVFLWLCPRSRVMMQRPNVHKHAYKLKKKNSSKNYNYVIYLWRRTMGHIQLGPQKSLRFLASAVLSRLEWYGMTFWTKLQHELLCFVCTEDEIFDSAGDRKGGHSRYRAVMWQMHV